MSMDNVLITGATGFLGSHLTEKLLEKGADVQIFVEKQENLGNIGHLKDDVKIIEGDITKPMQFDGVDIVFHFAAVANVGFAMENPKKTFEVNTFGTLNLLEALRDNNLEKFVFVSTSHVYGVPQYLPIDEGHPTNPSGPYAMSKLCAEKMVETYAIPFVIARLFNIYGPRQNPDFVVPTIIGQATNKDVIELGNLKSTRDFTYVDDVIEGLLVAAEKGNGVYNIGSGVETSILELVQSIIQLFERDISIKSKSKRKRSKNVEIPRMVANTSRINGLGWKPRTSLKVGLEMTKEAMV
ncbi:MAG: NAD-dependent epimerase/dehydratase family protein [Candidatus Hydrothermarchaeales archaeon]